MIKFYAVQLQCILPQMWIIPLFSIVILYTIPAHQSLGHLSYQIHYHSIAVLVFKLPFFYYWPQSARVVMLPGGKGRDHRSGRLPSAAVNKRARHPTDLCLLQMEALRLEGVGVIGVNWPPLAWMEGRQDGGRGHTWQYWAVIDRGRGTLLLPSWPGYEIRRRTGTSRLLVPRKQQCCPRCSRGSGIRPLAWLEEKSSINGS